MKDWTSFEIIRIGLVVRRKGFDYCLQISLFIISIHNFYHEILNMHTNLKKNQCFTGNVQCSPISIFVPDLLSYVYIFIPVTNCFHVIRVAFSFNEWQVLYSIDFSNLLLSYFQPQNEHIELHRKRHGYRLDYHERKSVKPRYCECFWGLTWPILIV